MKSYLAFQYQLVYGKKTKVIDVLAVRDGTLLGQIRWYGAWRQYCFYPEPDMIFSVGCMQDIQNEITKLMDERKDLRQVDRQKVERKVQHDSKGEVR